MKKSSSGESGGASAGGDSEQAKQVVSEGRLIVCPTPIGNLKDVTLRTLEALGAANVIACEDTRRTRILLNHYEIQTPLLSYHEHNERQRTSDLVARIGQGEKVALVSDAGMPMISDPGYTLVLACIEEELKVEVLPGPSAVLTALVVSGLPAEEWRFIGFLPRKRSALEAIFTNTETLVTFESPRRVGSSLAILAEVDPQRPVAVCRELTKLHEEVIRGKANVLAARYSEHPPRGEVVLVIGGMEAKEGALDAKTVEAVRRLIDAGVKPRIAAKVIADVAGLSANELYRAVAEN